MTRYVALCNSTELLYQPLLTSPDISSPLKPQILTPTVSNCCDCRLTPRNRPSFPLIYTSTETYIAASYHSHCKICSTTYYPSYYEKDNTQCLYNLAELKYLQLSSQTGFEINYLNNVTNQLSICSSTFESIAELYTINNMENEKVRLSKLIHFSRGKSLERPWKLNAQRLEEGWFLYRIGLFYQERGEMKANMHTKVVNFRRDFKALSGILCALTLQSWVEITTSHPSTALHTAAWINPHPRLPQCLLLTCQRIQTTSSLII